MLYKISFSFFNLSIYLFLASKTVRQGLRCVHNFSFDGIPVVDYDPLTNL